MTCCDSVSPSRTGKPVSAVTVLGKGKGLPLIAQFFSLDRLCDRFDSV